MKFKATFLLRPGNGSNTAGAFYIAVAHPSVNFVIYGPNNPNAKGSLKTYKNEREVTKKIREKTRKIYDEVLPNSISQGALDLAVEHIAKAFPQLRNHAPSFERDSISFPDAQSGSAAATSRRPRTSHMKLSDIWF